MTTRSTSKLKVFLVLPIVRPANGTGEGGRGVPNPEARLDEACGLAEAIALEVVGRQCVALATPRPATLFGRGKVAELASEFERAGAELVIVDASLSPVQQRNLERAWARKVLDRTALILEIFGERARTREGRLQVELAHLEYQRSRLVRSWTHLERQRGGVGFLGGPGETQIEADRRLLSERITRLKHRLADIKRTRSLHRKSRRQVPYPVIALVGYTNAGKSTLFNQLTSSTVRAEDMLFATLDPTMRLLSLPGGIKAILSDTVGFIADLPTELVAAFNATLEEVLEADVIVHVRDVSTPQTEAQCRDVLSVLERLGVKMEGAHRGDHTPMVAALNKSDLLDAHQRACWRQREGDEARLISARTGEGIDGFKHLLSRIVSRDRRLVNWVLSGGSEFGAALSWLYDHGEVLRTRECGNGTIAIKTRMTPANIGRFEKRFPSEILS